jgi:predicted lysophospholipase L1 biosynthesis ABC-type transport system permease subunit
MDNKTSYLEDLRIIRKVMEESSRFLTLSGLSGIFAGVFALAGAAIAYFAILKNGTIHYDELFKGLSIKETNVLLIQLLVVGLVVLFLAISVSLFFSIRKAKRTGEKTWTPVSKRMLINLTIPLLSGAVFILALLIHNQISLVVPAMLLFYGLALINAGKFTFSEIFYLGLFEMITGLTSSFFPAFGIYFWAFGFGILHITYGLIMFGKYER